MDADIKLVRRCMPTAEIADVYKCARGRDLSERMADLIRANAPTILKGSCFGALGRDRISKGFRFVKSLELLFRLADPDANTLHEMRDFLCLLCLEFPDFLADCGRGPIDEEAGFAETLEAGPELGLLLPHIPNGLVMPLYAIHGSGFIDNFTGNDEFATIRTPTIREFRHHSLFQKAFRVDFMVTKELCGGLVEGNCLGTVFTGHAGGLGPAASQIC